MPTGLFPNSPLPVSVEGEPTVRYADSPSSDAVGRLRTSPLQAIFHSKLVWDGSGTHWSQVLFAGGLAAHSTADARLRLTTAASGDSVIRQTFMRFNYQPGRSQVTTMSFLAPPSANVRQRIGLFHTSNVANSVPQNGIFFEVTAAAKTWKIAKGAAITESVAQASWNIDPLDGTGLSGITLDLSLAQILVIDYEWLGAGRVRVGFMVDGKIIYCHKFNHANETGITTVYTSTPNLPLGYSLYQSGAGAGVLDQISCAIYTDGSQEAPTVLRTADQGTASLTTGAPGVVLALIGIRLKTTHLDAVLKPHIISVTGLSPDNFGVRLYRNPAVAAAFVYGAQPASCAEVAIGVAVNVITGGIPMWGAYSSSVSREIIMNLSDILPLGADIAGVSDTYVLGVYSLTSPVTAIGAFSWQELL